MKSNVNRTRIQRDDKFAHLLHQVSQIWNEHLSMTEVCTIGMYLNYYCLRYIYTQRRVENDVEQKKILKGKTSRL